MLSQIPQILNDSLALNKLISSSKLVGINLLPKTILNIIQIENAKDTYKYYQTDIAHMHKTALASLKFLNQDLFLKLRGTSYEYKLSSNDQDNLVIKLSDIAPSSLDFNNLAELKSIQENLVAAKDELLSKKQLMTVMENQLFQDAINLSKDQDSELRSDTDKLHLEIIAAKSINNLYLTFNWETMPLIDMKAMLIKHLEKINNELKISSYKNLIENLTNPETTESIQNQLSSIYSISNYVYNANLAKAVELYNQHENLAQRAFFDALEQNIITQNNKLITLDGIDMVSFGAKGMIENINKALNFNIKFTDLNSFFHYDNMTDELKESITAFLNQILPNESAAINLKEYVKSVEAADLSEDVRAIFQDFANWYKIEKENELKAVQANILQDNKFIDFWSNYTLSPEISSTSLKFDKINLEEDESRDLAVNIVLESLNFVEAKKAPAFEEILKLQKDADCLIELYNSGEYVNHNIDPANFECPLHTPITHDEL